MKWLLLLSIAMSLLPTVSGLVDATEECRVLAASGADGLYLCDCRHVRRREQLRVLKHLLLALGVALGALDYRGNILGLDRYETRTLILVAVMFLLTLTSVLDRRHLARMKDCLRTRAHRMAHQIARGEEPVL